MSTVLGLDLGVSSIGWALVNEKEGAKYIKAMGSRIIPLSTDDSDEFSKGNAITKNQVRTTKRTQRKGYNRYQDRKKYVASVLKDNRMYPDDTLFSLSGTALFGLRDKAVSQQITLPELGRICYHLNQKRGYKSGRADANMDKKDTDYVSEVKNRYQYIKDAGITIGQYFYRQLKENQHYRTKQQVFPREAYVEEFDIIFSVQKKYYPDLLTNDFVAELRDRVIYYQRPLKSQKGLVSICEFEGRYRQGKNGKEVFTGPKVAPKSSPLFQVGKIWETINSIRLVNKRGDDFTIPNEKKVELFEYLNQNEKLTQEKLFSILGLKKSDGWYGNKQTEKGIQGNLTVTAIKKILGAGTKFDEVSRFNTNIVNAGIPTFVVDRKDGTITAENTIKYVAPEFEQEPLYRLWHIIYSISDVPECTIALMKQFGFTPDIAESLAMIDFVRFGFGNRSAKAIRKTLPYLMEGFVYSDAAAFAGYNHSGSVTRDEREKKVLDEALQLLPKNCLRQPVVEKILNQLINIVNAIIQQYGRPDEIRIELARELKQSREERNETYRSINKKEAENKKIAERIENEYRPLGVRATRNTIVKWRLFHEINNDESKINATCLYCGKQFGLTDALKGSSVDVEHIIPKAKLFDDSQQNKILAHRRCNEDKKDATAFDFMSSKGEQELKVYVERVNWLYENRCIGKGKRDKLLMPAEKIPKNFIDRQLRETQYISRKAVEILGKVCRNVWVTSGSVTERLRRLWGWDDVLMNLQLPKYQKLEGLTEIKEWETNDGQKHQTEVITGWTKRDDHRHHAIDALVIANTRQGFIQRINRLHAQQNRDEMKAEVDRMGAAARNGLTLLDRYLIMQRPFTTAQVECEAANILVSFKPGKRVAIKGVRKIKKDGKKEIVQRGIVVPRGPLSEESVYGRIMTTDKNKPLKYLLENPHLILKPYIKQLIEQHLQQHNGDVKKALSALKKEPLYIDEDKTIPLTYGTCYKEEVVIKYPIETIKAKDISYIVDGRIRQIVQERLDEYGGKEKEAFKTPVWYDEQRQIPIRTVRCFTGLSAVEPVKRDAQGRDIGFVKPGSNHHIAIYTDQNGKKVEHVCTFWHAVERVKYGIQAVIEQPAAVWDKILADRETYTETFLQKLPEPTWQLVMTMQQNEMFVLGLSAEELEAAMNTNDRKKISDHLYRVQKLASNDYWFRHHLETELNNSTQAKMANRFFYLSSIGALERLYPQKGRLDVLGNFKLFNP